MPLQPGDILYQRYRIEGRLGKGGMGVVYLAYDTTLDIQVAVKENLNLNPESERQFKREAKLLASLRHPNLPRVTDHFILEGRQYLVMDYIAGVNLHTQTESKRPTVDEVLSWANATCDALHYLHSRNPPIIHRDLKPANLKLQPDGTLLLVDFGIAKEFDQAQTTTGARGLTPGFSPPEQYGGQRTDARSDQYALAATIYDLLTNQRPTDSIERMLGKEDLKPARELNPDIPEHVEAALERALTLAQDGRFSDIEGFRAALQGKLDLKTIRAESLPAMKPPRRRLGLWIGGGALGLIVIGGGLALVLGGGLSGLGSDSTSTESVIAAVVPSGTPAITPQPNQTSTPTPTAIPTHTPTISPTPTATTFVLGGGGRIAFASDREDRQTLQIWTMNADGSDLRQVTFGPGDKTQPKWSPDGTRLLYVAPGGRDQFGTELGLDVFSMNLDRSGEAINLTQNPGDDTDPAWSPENTRISFTSTRVSDLRQVFILNIGCESQPGNCTPAGDPVNISVGFAVEFASTWSPDGQTLAVAASINQAGGRIYLRSTGGGTPTRFDNRDRIIGADHVDWSKDGQFLVFSWLVKRGQQEIYLVSIADPGLDPRQLTNTLGNKEPSFSPDGQFVIFTSTRDQNPEIYRMTINGTNQENLTNDPGRDLQPDWQPLTDG